MNDSNDMSSLRVLLVEDRPILRRLIGMSLNALGVQRIVDVKNGAEGLPVVKAARGGLDLIICDLEMPEMKGLEFLAKLRNGEICTRSKDTPVIIISGHSEPGYLQKSIQLGVQGFMIKPITTADLAKKIRSSVSAHASYADFHALGKQRMCAAAVSSAL